ncbi:MAG: hypothetical protein HZC01_04820 [Candidatus Kerfeldbacteria bacterium]|nr:hypothetical protein [Candidatus Kerfeldbacteria bacterium]
MIVFAALTPHPPLAIPKIGGEYVRFISETIANISHLGKKLAAAKPDTIIIISPHGQINPDAFTFNQAPTFDIQFKEFGDLETRLSVSGDIAHVHHYKELVESTQPVMLQSQPTLDHGIGVPTYLMYNEFPKKKKKPLLVPCYPSQKTLREHFQFTSALRDDILNDQKRIAIIASGDLSHRLSEDSPGGKSNWAEKFDEKIRTSLLNRDTESLLNLEPEFIDDAGECGLKPIIMLLGILGNLSYHPQVLSYEAPMGVGYLTIDFKV